MCKDLLCFVALGKQCVDSIDCNCVSCSDCPGRFLFHHTCACTHVNHSIALIVHTYNHVIMASDCICKHILYTDSLLLRPTRSHCSNRKVQTLCLLLRAMNDHVSCYQDQQLIVWNERTKSATTATATANIWIMYAVRLSINCSIEIETNSWSVDQSLPLVKALLAHTTLLSICRDCRSYEINSYGMVCKSLCIHFSTFFFVVMHWNNVISKSISLAYMNSRRK